MAVEKGLGSGKRFGARYGKKLRNKIALVELDSRSLHECPSCRYKKAYRLSTGIWKCSKCASVFTGRAYTTVKKISLREEVVPGKFAQEISEASEKGE